MKITTAIRLLMLSSAFPAIGMDSEESRVARLHEKAAAIIVKRQQLKRQFQAQSESFQRLKELADHHLKLLMRNKELRTFLENELAAREAELDAQMEKSRSETKSNDQQSEEKGQQVQETEREIEDMEEQVERIREIRNLEAELGEEEPERLPVKGSDSEEYPQIDNTLFPSDKPNENQKPQTKTIK